MLELDLSDNLSLELEGRHHRFDIFIEDVFPDHRAVFNDYEDEIWGASTRLNWTSGFGNTLLLGFDGDWGSYDWINYTDTYHTGNWALYLQDTFTHGAWTFSAGVRNDHNDDFGDETSPSAGVVYRFQKAGALIRTQIARGFSVPPASWVHDPQWGNPGLQPETALNVQLGGEIQPLPFLHCELNLFRAEVDELIRFDFNSLTFQNIEAVTRQGLEGDLFFTTPVGLSFSLGGSYTDVRDDQTDEVIADIPRSQYHLSLKYTHPRTTQTLVGRYIDHNSSFAETNDQVFVLDYRFKFFLPWPANGTPATIFGAVYNLLDQDYLYRNAWPQPGRWAEAGLQVVF